MTANTAAAGAAGPPGGSKRLAQQQAQVDEVVEIMKLNVDKVLERDKNLASLDDRADRLQHNAAQFEQQAGKLKRKFWLQNMKMMIIMGIVGTIFTVAVGAWAYSKYKALVPSPPSIDGEGGGALTPSVKDEVSKVSVATPVQENVTTKPPRRRRKKTTVASSTVASTDDNDESVLKRAIRALIQ